MSVMQHCQSSSGSSLSPLSHNTTRAEVWGDPQSDCQWDHKSSMEAKQLLSIQPAPLLQPTQTSQSAANWELVASSAIEKLTTVPSPPQDAGWWEEGGEGREEISSWSPGMSVNVWPVNQTLIMTGQELLHYNTWYLISHMRHSGLCPYRSSDVGTDSPACRIPEQVYEWSYESDLVFYKLIISQIL